GHENAELSNVAAAWCSIAARREVSGSVQLFSLLLLLLSLTSILVVLAFSLLLVEEFLNGFAAAILRHLVQRLAAHGRGLLLLLLAGLPSHKISAVIELLRVTGLLLLLLIALRHCEGGAGDEYQHCYHHPFHPLLLHFGIDRLID
ncbi:hypothetical protein P5F45_16270, partial [Clostridium perfringens]|nr:hypothetical protein [Clostridium perfringens]